MSLPVSAPIRVLIIEDNEDDVTLLTRQLDKAGMIGQVKFLANGLDALDFLLKDEQATKLMVIFLDLKLPGLGGLELLRRMKTMEAVSDIPVVIMTSSTDPSDVTTCKELGVAHYVEKPVTFSSFSKSMADVFHLPRKTSTQSIPNVLSN